MSADFHAPTHNHDAHGHGAHGHDHAIDDRHGHGDEEAHGSFRGYVIGFVLAAILTAIPFWMVMTHPLSNQATALIIMAFAAVQIIVHMIFFLHMNRRAEGGWSMMAMLFTIVIIGISLSGSLWVMYHMNANMMPTQEQLGELQQ